MTGFEPRLVIYYLCSAFFAVHVVQPTIIATDLMVPVLPKVSGRRFHTFLLLFNFVLWYAYSIYTTKK
jgi:hypothetical protein